MLKIDLHIHSVASHALNTIYEIIRSASKKSMKLIALTEHGSSIEGAPIESYFELVSRIPKKICGVEVLKGCEANILNEKGDIDLGNDTLKRLDLVLAGIHNGTPYKKRDINSNTKAMINCMKRGDVDIISHPFKTGYPVDIPSIVECAKNTGVLLELNVSIFKPFNKPSLELIEKTREMIELCRRYNLWVVINSDAHIAHEIGDDSVIQSIFDLRGLNILNNDYPTLKAFIKKWKEKRNEV